jgi:hypothetical protein
MTEKITVIASSRVKAFLNASSWSASFCWMYLSPIPTSLRKRSVDTASRITANRP